MLIGIDMIAVQANDGRLGESGRLGLDLLKALLALDTNHRYVLYTQEGLPTGPIPLSRNALRVALPAGPGGPKASLRRVIDHNPDGLDWMVFLDPFDPESGGMPAEAPLHGLKIASLIADLSPSLIDDRRLGKLRRHDAILVYSEATEIELRRRLPSATLPIRRIGLACGDAFAAPDRSEPLSMRPGDELGRLGITGPFFLANMGAGAGRGNLAGILDAYRLLPLEHRVGHQMVVAGSIDDPWAAIAFLHDYGCAEDLVLVGPVDGPSLVALYARCSAFVSPSIDEGSGLPLVEAMSCGAPVVAGTSETQASLLGGSGLLADPFKPGEIARQVSRILTDADTDRDLRAKSTARSRDFSGEDMALEFLGALAKEPAHSKVRHRFDRGHSDRPRIAIYADSSSTNRSASDLDETLTRACRSHYDVDVYFEPKDAARLQRLPIDCGGFLMPQFGRNDEILDYHAVLSIATDVFSLKSKLDRFRARPGLVFLQDETSLERIGTENAGEASADFEAEVASHRLRELFLTGSRLAVRTRRDFEAIRSSLPGFADQVCEIPMERGSSRIFEILAEWIDRSAADLPRGPGRPYGRASVHSSGWLAKLPVSRNSADKEGQAVRTG